MMRYKKLFEQQFEPTVHEQDIILNVLDNPISIKGIKSILRELGYKSDQQTIKDLHLENYIDNNYKPGNPVLDIEFFVNLVIYKDVITDHYEYRVLPYRALRADKIMVVIRVPKSILSRTTKSSVLNFDDTNEFMLEMRKLYKELCKIVSKKSLEFSMDPNKFTVLKRMANSIASIDIYSLQQLHDNYYFSAQHRLKIHSKFKNAIKNISLIN